MCPLYLRLQVGHPKILLSSQDSTFLLLRLVALAQQQRRPLGGACLFRRLYDLFMGTGGGVVFGTTGTPGFFQGWYIISSPLKESYGLLAGRMHQPSAEKKGTVVDLCMRHSGNSCFKLRLAGVNSPSFLTHVPVPVYVVCVHTWTYILVISFFF